MRHPQKHVTLLGPSYNLTPFLKNKGVRLFERARMAEAKSVDEARSDSFDFLKKAFTLNDCHTFQSDNSAFPPAHL